MTLYARLHPDAERRIAERRVDDVDPVIDRRSGEDRRAEPRWRTWTRANQAAKALSGRVAA